MSTTKRETYRRNDNGRITFLVAPPTKRAKLIESAVVAGIGIVTAIIIGMLLSNALPAAAQPTIKHVYPPCSATSYACNIQHELRTPSTTNVQLPTL